MDLHWNPSEGDLELLLRAVRGRWPHARTRNLQSLNGPVKDVFVELFNTGSVAIYQDDQVFSAWRQALSEGLPLAIWAWNGTLTVHHLPGESIWRIIPGWPGGQAEQISKEVCLVLTGGIENFFAFY